MANESTYASIASVVNAIWEEAILAAREMMVVQPLVKNMSGDGLTPRKWTNYAGGTVQEIAETDDLTAQTFTHAVGGTLTPVTKASAYYLTDSRIASDWANARGDAATDLGQIIAVQIDTDLVNNFANLTGGTAGTAGGTLTFANVLYAAAKVRAQKVSGVLRCVLHPVQMHYVLSGSVPDLVKSPRFMDSLASNWYVGGYGGIEFFTDANIASGTAAVGAIFAESAIAYDLRRAFRIEPQRDASRGGGGWELNATTQYATGVYRPLFGAKLIGTSV